MHVACLGRIKKLERRLTNNSEGEALSDTSVSPVTTPRPDSPTSLPMLPTPPSSLRRKDSKISLEDELKRSRQAEEVRNKKLKIEKKN